MVGWRVKKRISYLYVCLMVFLGSANAGKINIQVDDGSLSLTAQGIPLRTALEVIIDESDLSIAFLDRLEGYLLSDEFEHLLLEDGLRRILDDVPVIFHHTAEGDLAGVYILGKGDEPDFAQDSTVIQKPNPVNDAPVAGAWQDPVADLVDGGISSLRSAVAYDVDTVVRRAGVIGVSKFSSKLAVPVLHSALQDSDTRVRRQAVVALGRMTHNAATTGLLGEVLLSSDDAELRLLAVSRLARIGGTQALTLLRTAQSDRDAEVRAAVNQALAEREAL